MRDVKNTMDKAEVVVSGKCTVCGKPLNGGRLFVCKECEAKTVMDNTINDLEIAKRLLASPFSLDMPMRIQVGRAITKAIELLKRRPL